MNILLVDDSPTIRQVIRLKLGQMGHEVEEAEDGADAILKFQAHKPDLILLDVEMPTMNGFETAGAIREIDAADEDWVPIIFLSANMDESLIEQGRLAGGDDFLIKPVSPAILATRLTTIGHVTRMRDQISRLSEELEHTRLELSRLTSTDAVTGLANSNGLTKLLDKHWQHCIQHDKPLSVLMIQIDHFNAYALSSTHAKVDVCLKMIVDVLQQHPPRQTRHLARTGSDTFATLLTGVDLNNAIQYAEAIRKGVEELEFTHSDSPTAACVTVSIGIATTVPEAHLQPQDLLNDASDALNDARESGHNCALINPKSFN